MKKSILLLILLGTLPLLLLLGGFIGFIAVRLDAQGLIDAAFVIPVTILFLLAASGSVYLVYKYFNYYPTIKLDIELTNKNKMDNNDLIDFYIINFGTEQIDNHIKKINEWKNSKIDSYKGNERKVAKFKGRCSKNQQKAFKFIGYRVQTRYRQVNYVKHPYKVEKISNEISASDQLILNRIAFLKAHDYDVTFNQYTKTDQRKAMTQKLRVKIKERDNYTCQECGKHMPDEVGLQIDHIVPIAKGGKSTPANLRVLCSKCNGRKGGK